MSMETFAGAIPAVAGIMNLIQGLNAEGQKGIDPDSVEDSGEVVDARNDSSLHRTQGGIGGGKV